MPAAPDAPLVPPVLPPAPPIGVLDVPAVAPPVVPAPVIGLFAAPVPDEPATGAAVAPALLDGESSPDSSLQATPAMAATMASATSTNDGLSCDANLAMLIDSPVSGPSSVTRNDFLLSRMVYPPAQFICQ
jgi:hypothetical protein